MLFYDPKLVKDANQLTFADTEDQKKLDSQGQTFQIIPTQNQALLEFQNVHIVDKQLNQTLSNISFSLNPGDNLIILGPEGSGKVLLLDLITGKRKPEKGRVTFLGEDIHKKGEDALSIYHSCLGFISYNFGLVNNLNVLENVLLPLRYHSRISDALLKERAMVFLKRYNLEKKALSRPQRLSHSENLRVAFVRAIIAQPMLILMDHALASQCPIALAKFIEIAEEDLEKNHISFLLTTFEHSVFQKYAQKYILLYDGEIVFQGMADDIQNSENKYLQQYLNHPLNGPMTPFDSHR